MSNVRGVSIVGAGFGGLGVADQLAHVIITNLLNHKENIW
jgi:NADH dehydrogenase FAD-containing subunit